MQLDRKVHDVANPDFDGACVTTEAGLFTCDAVGARNQIGNVENALGIGSRRGFDCCLCTDRAHGGAGDPGATGSVTLPVIRPNAFCAEADWREQSARKAPRASDRENHSLASIILTLMLYIGASVVKGAQEMCIFRSLTPCRRIITINVNTSCRDSNPFAARL